MAATYNGNPVTATAGLITLEKMTPAAYARLDWLGDLLREKAARPLLRPTRTARTGAGPRLFCSPCGSPNEPLTDWRSLSRHNARQPDLRPDVPRDARAGSRPSLPAAIVGCLSTPMGEPELVTLVDALDETLTVLDRPA